jgi:hypothetical protein
MDFTDQKALARRYDPVTASTHVLIPYTNFGYNTIFERDVKGKFERGKLLLVSGGCLEKGYTAVVSNHKAHYEIRGEYREIVESFAKILDRNFDYRLFKMIEESIIGAPSGMWDELKTILVKITPDYKKKHEKDNKKTSQKQLPWQPPDYLRGWK